MQWSSGASLHLDLRSSMRTTEKENRLKDWKETLARKCSILWITFFLLLATAAHAQVTSLSLFSDPGDFVGGGQNAFFTPADGSFSTQVSADGNVISVNFVGQQPGVFWDLQFAACCGSPLVLPGVYFADGLAQPALRSTREC